MKNANRLRASCAQVARLCHTHSPMGLEEEMKAFVKAGLAHHDSTCPMPAKAILLNPANHELFGWDELFGIPCVPDDRVAPKRFRIHCEGSAFGIEEAIEEFQRGPVEPLVVPVGPGGPHEDLPETPESPWS